MAEVPRLARLAERRSASKGTPATQGILRIDLGKPHRSSGTSVEFTATAERLIPQQSVESASPQPSVDRLSVSFAPQDRTEPEGMDKVRFSKDETAGTENEDTNDDEDYSASASAILQRRASTRRHSGKRRRRPSSPFSPDSESLQFGARRRSSVFTTSSGDTAISVDDGTTQEQIFQNIRLHKEVLSNVKYQPWPMRRKMKLVQQAKAYIKRHEGELQERLAQSKSTKDILAHFNIILINQWHHIKREVANFANVLIPWEHRIKEIESHFGSVVASYFTFLRWLFWVNFVTAAILITFVAVPELLTADHSKTGERKQMLPEEEEKAWNLITLWNFEGVLKYSPIFYGYYTNQYDNGKGFRYRMPLAYFLTGLAVYIYSFVAILRKMAENSRQSKLSEKDDECIFTWKVFTGWDYTIGNSETAHNRTASIILGFKEALLEEAEKIRDEKRNWKMVSLRLCGHMNVLWLLATSVYAVILVVQRSTEPEGGIGWWRQNEITVVVSLIGFIYPMIFDLHSLIERYHPRKALRLQLARIMGLNLLNLYSFIFATFSKINNMTNELKILKPNESVSAPSVPSFKANTEDINSWYESTVTSTTYPVFSTTLGMGEMAKICFKVVTNCTDQILSNTSSKTISTFATMLLSTHVTNTQLPSMTSLGNNPIFLDNITVTMYNNLSIETQDNFQLENTDTYDPEKFHMNSTLYENTSVNDSGNTVQTDSMLNFTTGPHFSNIHLITDSKQNNFESIISDLKENEMNGDITQSNVTSQLTSQHDDGRTSTFTENSSEQQTEYYSTTSEPCYIVRCIEKPLESINYTNSVPQPTEPFLRSSNNEYDDNQLTDTTEPDAPLNDLSIHTARLDLETRRKLRNLCWETKFGQELVKLTIMDLILTIASILMMDFFRALFVRVMNNCWCWDLENTFPQYGDFKIAENILHLVNNQGMVWMGMFFSPALPLINLLKLTIIMYLRSWTVLTCNVPHEVVFRASRSNNFYFALLLTMLFLCVLPVGYAIVWVEPSWHCGPFSNNKRIYHLFTRSLKALIPKSLHRALDYIASPGIVIPLLMLLILIIYYLISLTNALREANNDLKIQLRRERTEERRKMFQLADKQRYGNSAETPYAKWKKILPAIPIMKSSTENAGISKMEVCYLNSSKRVLEINETKEASSKQGAIRKSSATSEEGIPIPDDDYDGLELTQLSKEKDLKPGKSKIKNLPGVVRNLLGNKQKDGEPRKVMEPAVNRNKNVQRKRYINSYESSKVRERGNSVTSGWSGDNIPEIRISETDSINSKLQNDFSRRSDSSSTDTIILVESKDKILAQDKNILNETKVLGGSNDLSRTSNKEVAEPKNNRREKKINKINQPAHSSLNENDIRSAEESRTFEINASNLTNLGSVQNTEAIIHSYDKDVNINPNEEVIEMEESISSEGENYDSIAKSVREFSELSHVPDTASKDLTFMDQN